MLKAGMIEREPEVRNQRLGGVRNRVVGMLTGRLGKLAVDRLDVSPRVLPASDGATPDTPDVAGLTPEEAGFVQDGLLPRNFAALRNAQRQGGTEAAKKIARAGLAGPFSPRFGDPNVMLDGAKRFRANPDLERLVRSIQPGDILVTTYNKDNDVISQATKGPFVHSLICSAAGPPPEFIEALGLTGNMKDPDSNKVLRSMMAEQAGTSQTIRLLRPAAQLPAHEAAKAVRRAIAYAEDQLGKPYDFAFTHRNGRGMNDAFYCSELTFKAYTHPDGADIEIAIDKSPERDEALAAVGRVLDGLDPDDKGALSYEVAQMTTRRPIADDRLVDFIMDKVLPTTAATREIADTPERRAAMKAAVRKVIAGKGFPATGRALDSFASAERGGRYSGVFGFFRRVGGMARIAWSAVSDARHLTKGIGFWRSVRTAWRVAQILTPHMETTAKVLFGPDDPRTLQARQALDTLDGLARDARRIPLVGRLWPLPSRERAAINRDFVSPTDLGWADLPHWDFNVKPESPVDRELYKFPGS